VSDGAVDASALLASILDEPGADAVAALIGHAVMSVVNVAEVVSKLADIGVPEREIRMAIDEFGLEIAPFTEAQAYIAGLLRPLTRHLGLSLGDRACLALAIGRSLPVITAERRWAELRLPIDVITIR